MNWYPIVPLQTPHRPFGYDPSALHEELVVRYEENNSFDYAKIKQNTTQDTIREVGTGVVNLLLKKNKDYGSSVFESPILFPELKAKDCILIRMSDKIKRFSNLVGNNTSPEVNESIEDTMKDLAGYAILWLVANSMETSDAVSRD